MKVKQKSVRVFEIECDNIAEFEAYLDKNSILLNGFLMLLKGDAKGVFAKECKKRGLCYAAMGECDESALAFKKELAPRIEEEQKPKPIVEKELEAPKPVEVKPETPKKQPVKPQAKLPLDEKVEAPKPSQAVSKTLTLTRNLRSGEDINTDSDVTLMGRINSGARVKTSGNAVILDVVDGDVDVGGDYVMLKNIGKGSVSLKGAKIDKNALNGKIKLVTFDGKLSIKDV